MELKISKEGISDRKFLNDFSNYTIRLDTFERDVILSLRKGDILDCSGIVKAVDRMYLTDDQKLELEEIKQVIGGKCAEVIKVVKDIYDFLGVVELHLLIN